ncbi:hypothetical protein OPU71_06170 [Niveibacterium sp. 24ML]|uniref:hypothetical protein n=1 Tax=Niveibacterium sp. 24ML TaxID=2985512 RepID=UPI002270DEC2|nr:hypothetical protein [Niveibacterium sp. 24ML]MCX9155709.1 hypothetical protein [Niveibacterium sp. 24ML]
MSRVRIDFAPAARWRIAAPALLGLLVLAIILGALGQLAKQRESALAVLRAQQLASSTPAAPRVQFPQPTPEQAELVNAAITQLNLPWPALLDALDAARPADVALLRIEPRARQRNLRVVAESERADALFDFADALGKQAVFVRLRPVSQVRLDSPARVQAAFDLEWRP